MKIGRDALQSVCDVILDRENQFAGARGDAEISQKGQQPVARQSVVVLRENFFYAGRVIFSGGKIGAEQEPVLRADERRQFWQNFLRRKIWNHAEESDECRVTGDK